MIEFHNKVEIGDSVESCDSVEIRDMEDIDYNQVRDIMLQAIYEKNATFRDSCEDYEEWDKGHHRFCRFVATISNCVVGFVAISPISSRACYQGVADLSIYIDKKHRGMGIGKILMSRLVEESEKFGIWTLQASIFQMNHSSITLHEKSGFRIVGYRENIAKDLNGIWQNIVLMERRSEII